MRCKVEAGRRGEGEKGRVPTFLIKVIEYYSFVDTLASRFVFSLGPLLSLSLKRSKAAAAGSFTAKTTNDYTIPRSLEEMRKTAPQEKGALQDEASPKTSTFTTRRCPDARRISSLQ